MASGDLLWPFLAWDGQPPATGYPTKDYRNGREVLDFDAAADETTYFQGWMPANYAGGGVRCKVYAKASAATSGTARVGICWERGNTDADADSFASEKQVALTADATSGITFSGTLDFANSEIDGVLAGEPFRIKFTRDADGSTGTDDMSGDLELELIVLTEI